MDQSFKDMDFPRINPSRIWIIRGYIHGYRHVATLAAMFYNPQPLPRYLVTYAAMCYNPQPLQQYLVNYAVMCYNPHPLQQHLVPMQWCNLTLIPCSNNHQLDLKNWKTPPKTSKMMYFTFWVGAVIFDRGDKVSLSVRAAAHLCKVCGCWQHIKMIWLGWGL